MSRDREANVIHYAAALTCLVVLLPAQTTVQVPANGTPAMGPTLTKGTVYELRASGTCTISKTDKADAEYYRFPGAPTDGSVLFDHGIVVHTYKPKWGAYSPSHTYSILVCGDDKQLKLHYRDSKYDDNRGSLQVLIRPAQKLETVKVPAGGKSMSSTNVLKQGVTYLLRASGTLRISATHLADAEYYDPGTWKDPLDDNPVADHGIAVNGTKVRWGSFEKSHVYCIAIVGDGTTGSFHYVDSKYTGNSGELTVEIYEGQPTTFGQGCPGSGNYTPALSLDGTISGRAQRTRTGALNLATVWIKRGLGGAPAVLTFGLLATNLSIGGGCALLAEPIVVIPGVLRGSGPGNGMLCLPLQVPPQLVGCSAVLQGLIVDLGASSGIGVVTTNGVLLNIR